MNFQPAAASSHPDSISSSSPAPASASVRVLFVCLANICRSPMAQAVFCSRVAAAGLAGTIEADSAATAHLRLGEPPHQMVRKLLDEQQIAHIEHKARLLRPEDLLAFDYILTMDDDNFRSVAYLGKRTARLEPLLKYAPGCGHREVPDPLRTGTFEEVYQLVDKASQGLLDAIRRERGL